MQAPILANKVPQVVVSSTSNDFKALGDLRGLCQSGRIHNKAIHTRGELTLREYLFIYYVLTSQSCLSTTFITFTTIYLCYII